MCTYNWLAMISTLQVYSVKDASHDGTSMFVIAIFATTQTNNIVLLRPNIRTVSAHFFATSVTFAKTQTVWIIGPASSAGYRMSDANLGVTMFRSHGHDRRHSYIRSWTICPVLVLVGYFQVFDFAFDLYLLIILGQSISNIFDIHIYLFRTLLYLMCCYICTIWICSTMCCSIDGWHRILLWFP